MREALPIQCLEAVMLGCFLTTKWQNVDRVPISFKSFVKPINRSFRHIVLAVRHQGKWGAIGLSRKDTLMYKKVKFPSLSALIKDYQLAYEQCWHVLKKVYVGFPFRHEPLSMAPIKWRVLNLRIDKHPWVEVADSLDTYAKDLHKLADYYHHHQRLPDSFSATYIFKKAVPLRVLPYRPGETMGSPKAAGGGGGGAAAGASGATASSAGGNDGTTPKKARQLADAESALTPTTRAAMLQYQDPHASSSDEEVVPAPGMASTPSRQGGGGRRRRNSHGGAAAAAAGGGGGGAGAASGSGKKAGAKGTGSSGSAGAGGKSSGSSGGGSGSGSKGEGDGDKSSGGAAADGGGGRGDPTASERQGEGDEDDDEDDDEDGKIAEAPNVSNAQINQAFLAV